MFFVFYQTALRPDFSGPGLEATVMTFAVSMAMLAALIAATIIDARLFIIPLPIPWLVTLLAFLLLPLSIAVWPEQAQQVKLTSEFIDSPWMTPDELFDRIEPPYGNAGEVRAAILRGSIDPVEISPVPIASQINIDS